MLLIATRRQAKATRGFFLFKLNPSTAALSVYKAESRRISKLVRFTRRQFESKLVDDVKSNV